MRYGPIRNIVRLAIELQSRPSGLTIDGIQQQFRCSRRTAERMKSAVEECFGCLHQVETDDRKIHWRLESRALRGLVRVSPEEIREVASVADALEVEGRAEEAASVRQLLDKVVALFPFGENSPDRSMALRRSVGAVTGNEGPPSVASDSDGDGA